MCTPFSLFDQVGIIGVGRIGRCHCASVASVPGKAVVSMICDIYQPALDEVSAIYHVPKTTTDPMEVKRPRLMTSSTMIRVLQYT